MNGGYQFETLRAVELVDAREEVIEFAVELHESDRKGWERSCAEAARVGKPAPQKSRLAFDLEHCRTESRRIRLKRERTETYWNQLTNPNPQY